jgi:mannose-6-phosphate isomerase-like protein (cupin superfamily)
MLPDTPPSQAGSLPQFPHLTDRHQGPSGFFHSRLSNLLSNTNKRDLIPAFHGSGTGNGVIRGHQSPATHPHYPLSIHRIRLTWTRRSGVTNATISLIEQNRVSPSVSSLKKLLEGIPMSLADFFTFDQPPREHQYVFRANEQPDLGRHGLRLLLIGASVPSRQMRLLREQYAPGASSGEEPIVHAEGEECGLVTRGTVELTVDGQISVLNAGDGYYFPTTLPHKFRNIGQDEAEIISANTPANF